MGAAAYRRGSKHLRHQIDAEIAANQSSGLKDAFKAQEQTLQKQAAKIERLEAKLERAMKFYRLRTTELAAYREENRAQAKEVERLFKLAVDRGHEVAELDRRWKVISHILRDNFSEEDIDRMKEEVYQQFPFMRRKAES